MLTHDCVANRLNNADDGRRIDVAIRVIYPPQEPTKIIPGNLV